VVAAARYCGTCAIQWTSLDPALARSVTQDPLRLLELGLSDLACRESGMCRTAARIRVRLAPPVE